MVPRRLAKLFVRADVAELVDAHGSGPCGGNPVEVQVLSSASMTDGDRFDDIDELLARRGRDVAGGRARVAAGKTGIAIGFPEKPVLHVSWGALAGIAVLRAVRRRRRRRNA